MDNNIKNESLVNQTALWPALAGAGILTIVCAVAVAAAYLIDSGYRLVLVINTAVIFLYMAVSIGYTAYTIRNIQKQIDETIYHRTRKHKDMFRSINSKLSILNRYRKGATGEDYIHYNRLLSEKDINALARIATDDLKLDVDNRRLRYMARQLVSLESRLHGRIAGAVRDILIRSLALQSIRTEELTILEIGVLFGLNAAFLYQMNRPYYKNFHMVLIDPLYGYYDESQLDPVTQVPPSRYVLESNLDRTGITVGERTILQGLSSEEQIIEGAAKRLYDMIFIDGDHSYEGVKLDFDIYHKMVKPSGYIIFDDYDRAKWPGVVQFIDNDIPNYTDIRHIGTYWHTTIYQKH